MPNHATLFEQCPTAVPIPNNIISEFAFWGWNHDGKTCYRTEPSRHGKEIAIRIHGESECGKEVKLECSKAVDLRYNLTEKQFRQFRASVQDFLVANNRILPRPSHLNEIALSLMEEISKLKGYQAIVTSEVFKGAAELTNRCFYTRADVFTHECFRSV